MAKLEDKAKKQKKLGDNPTFKPLLEALMKWHNYEHGNPIGTVKSFHKENAEGE